MKKLLFVITFIFIIGVYANAQQFSYGVKAGANISTMDADGDKAKTGFNGGAFGQLRMANFAIQPEILYSVQGAKYDYETHGGCIIFQYTGKVNLAYLSVPVMLQYYIIPGLAVEAGPQLGFLLSAKNKPDEWESQGIKSYTKSTDFALNFGASYQVPELPLGVYVRYSLGLTDIFEREQYEVFEGSSGKNRIMQFGLFVRF